MGIPQRRAGAICQLTIGCEGSRLERIGVGVLAHRARSAIIIRGSRQVHELGSDRQDRLVFLSPS